MSSVCLEINSYIQNINLELASNIQSTELSKNILDAQRNFWNQQ